MVDTVQTRSSIEKEDTATIEGQHPGGPGEAAFLYCPLKLLTTPVASLSNKYLSAHFTPDRLHWPIKSPSGNKSNPFTPALIKPLAQKTPLRACAKRADKGIDFNQ